MVLVLFYIGSGSLYKTLKVKMNVLNVFLINKISKVY